MLIDKYLSKKTQVFIVISLLFIILYFTYAAFLSYKDKRQVPEFKINESILDNKQIEYDGGHKQDKNSFQEQLGALAVSFINSSLGEGFRDIMSINLDNAYVIFASDNNPEWEYIDLTGKDMFAMTLVKRVAEDKYTLAAGDILGIRPPNIMRSSAKINDFAFARHLSLSPDKSKLLYVNNIDDESFIFLYDIKNNKKEEKLAKGSQPKWISSQKFLFTDKTSLKILNSKNGKVEKLWEPAVDAIGVIDLSDDAEVLAVYLPEYKRVSILKLYKDGDIYQVKQQGAIEVSPKSMVLSPNGKYLAVLTGGENNWRIALYNTETLKKIDSVLDKSQLFDFSASKEVKILDWF